MKPEGRLMPKILIRLFGLKSKKRSFLQGVGSVINLGGAGQTPKVQIFHARTPEQSMRSAWKVAMGHAEGWTKGQS
jgi:hypothetical protein